MIYDLRNTVPQQLVLLLIIVLGRIIDHLQDLFQLTLEVC